MMPYCTPAEVRARYSALADDTTWPDDLLAELIAEFEDITERYRGIAYLPRTVTETVTVPAGSTWSRVDLDHAPVRSVSIFTIDGTAASSYTLDSALGSITDVPCTQSTTSTVLVITYDHGLDAPPAGILRACKMYVRNAARADTSGTSRDVLSQAVDGATTRYATPDWNAGRPTGYLDVDRLLNSQPDYRVPAIA